MLLITLGVLVQYGVDLTEYSLVFREYHLS